MRHFRLVDNLMGWLTFAIAAFVYCSTVEPTASFWDCPEFITTAYKLEVGHPPGAPFFMLTANLFTQFVSDPTKVAIMVNMMSALFSAACIMFLFWSISHLARKLVGTDGQVQNLAQLITVEASALTGALVYTFSDTFWFSAVEGEVYAYSSLFTAVVFWLMLKWEDHADEPGSDRWLIFIAYLTGLSIGVHLLNLLCLPALVLIFYYRKVKNATLTGALLSVAGSGLLIAAVLYGIVPGIVKVGGWFELRCVNDFNMPFNTGVIIYIALLVAIVLWSIWETAKNESRIRMNISYLLSVAMLGIPFYGYGWSSIIWGILVLILLFVALQFKSKEKNIVSARLMNTSLLCMLMIMIGYSSYALIVIRSSANTPMDQNSPEDIFTLGTYLSREQYGDRPLFYGPAYTSQVLLKPDGNYCVPVSNQGAPVIQRKEKESPDEPDRYEIQRYKTEYVYQQNMYFPRMYSEAHASAYESWMGGVKGTVRSYERCGEMVQVKTPTQLENLRFFLSYQVNFMYWRYFMWNFAGRQNDLQGNGEWEHGNWITGIPFLDNIRLGDQSKLPSELRENKGRNVFYCLPLLLGLIGILWQLFGSNLKTYGEGEKQFGIVFFLFAAPRTRLCLRRLLLCLCHLDWSRSGWHRLLSAETHQGQDHLCGLQLPLHPCAHTDGRTDVGRPRPQRTLHLPRLRKELPRVARQDRQPHHLHQRRQRHLPPLVCTGDGRLPHRRSRLQPLLPADRLVHRPDEASGLRLPGCAHPLEQAAVRGRHSRRSYRAAGNPGTPHRDIQGRTRNAPQHLGRQPV